MSDLVNAMTATEKAAAQFSYGDMITHTWLKENLGVAIPEFGSRDAIQNAQLDFLGAFETLRYELLTGYQMYLSSVRGEGYRVVLPKEQVGLAMEQLEKRVSAEIRKASAAIENVRVDMLEQDDMRRRDDAVARIGSLSALGLCKK